jgi:heme/copper-type cytochrome/quinol oxidase subunit 3
MTSVTIGSPDLHVEDPDLIGRRWRTGVILLILADASFVAALIFSYFYLRGLNTEKAWLAPKQQTADIWVGWAIAGGAVLAAAAYHWAATGIRAGNESRLVLGASVATLVVVADSVGQFIQLATFPFGVSESAYASTVYTLAGANLFHLLLTIFLGLAMANRGRLHIYSATSNWQVRLVGIWFTWIALAAVLGAFATSFIASPNGR